MAIVTIDGYRFSGVDADRTMQLALDMLDLYPPAVQRLQGARRAAIEAAVAAGDLPTVWHQLVSARDDAVDAGVLPITQIGRVVQLNVSNGGVPKSPVHAVEVGLGGVVGDRQAARVHHGRPWQALCVWSAEVIDSLNVEGHSLAPGRAGENVTVSGIDWGGVWPGVRLEIGEVVCQITAFALPCRKNAQWFVNGEFMRMHHGRGPVSRAYAVVLEPGRIEVGDVATLEP
jgi:MOSC domain-containing protein YiiM